MWGALDLFEFAHGLSTWGAAVGAVAPEAALSAITGIVFILHLFGVVRVVVVLLLHYLLLLFLLGVLVILGVSLLLLLGHHALLLLLALMIVVHHFADAPPGRGSPALAVAAASCASSSPCSCRPGPAPALTAAASPTGGAAAAAARLPLAAPPGRGGGGRRGLGSAGSLLLGPRRLRLGRGRPPAAAAAALPGAQPADGARRGRGARRSGGRRRLLLLGRPAAPAPHRWALAEGEGRGRAAREGARSPDRRLRASSAPRGGRGAGAGGGPGRAGRGSTRIAGAPLRIAAGRHLVPRLRLGRSALTGGSGTRPRAPHVTAAPAAAARGRARRGREGAAVREPPRRGGPATPDRTRHRPPTTEPTSTPGIDNGTDPQPESEPGTDRRHQHRFSPLYPPLAPFPSAGTRRASCPSSRSRHRRSLGRLSPGLTLSSHQCRWARGRGLSQSSTRAPKKPLGPSGAALREGRAGPRAGAPHGGLHSLPKSEPWVSPQERLPSAVGTKQLP